MSTLFAKIGIALMFVGSLLGLHQEIPQNYPSQDFGTTNVSPINGSTYNLAGSGITSSATSIVLSSFTIPQSGYKITDSDNIGSTFYVTFEPGSRTKQEVASCTTHTQNVNSTATLSGCSRGLAPISPHTASTTLQFAHGGGTQVIFGDAAQLFNQYAAKTNDETISGTYTFSGTKPPVYDIVPVGHGTGSYFSTTSEVASVAYVNATALVSAPNASSATKGVVQLPTSGQLAAGTSAGSTGANLVISNSFASSSCDVATRIVPVTQSTGTIKSNCIDQTASYAWTASTTISATTSIKASDVNGFPLKLNSVSYAFPSSQGAASSTLTNDGSGNVSWQTPEWSLLATSTLTGSAATTTLTFPSRTNIMIMINAVHSGATGGGTINMQFNTDTAANYGYDYISGAGSTISGATANTQKNIVLDGNNGTSITSGGGVGIVTVTIPYNSVGQRKYFTWHGAFDNGGTTIAPTVTTGTGVYNSTSAAITSVSFGAGFITSGSPTLNAGTSIQVYGSKI